MMIPSSHMGAKTLISVEEYLRTPYESPEPDFVNGEIVERTMPNNPHSRAVIALIKALLRQAPDTLFERPELRVRSVPGRYRVADLAVFDHDFIEEEPSHAPLIVVEVLSPAESHAELMRKFADYAAIGIPHIWLVDPIAKRFSIYHDESLTATTKLEVPEHGVSIRPSDIFTA